MEDSLSENNSLKVVVAHPFRQHSYMTAAAFKKAGCLNKFLTTSYFKKRTLLFLLSRFLKNGALSRAKSRRCCFLNDDDILIYGEFSGLLLLFLQRVGKSKRIYDWWYKRTINRFNRSVFRFIKKNEVDVLVVYDTLSGNLLKRMRRHLGRRPLVLVDMSAPVLKTMNELFLREAGNYPIGLIEEDLRDIRRADRAGAKNSAAELALADGFLVASDFTKNSLLVSGVDAQNIYKCVYGNSQPGRTRKAKTNNRLVFIFSGSACLQKGFYTLIEAIHRLKEINAEFHFYGSYNDSAQEAGQSAGNCFFHGHIAHSEMMKVMSSFADVLVFPSFSDGFGISILEAMSFGVVPVCSQNAGASELITDGVNGFVFPAGDSVKLAEILDSLYKNRAKLAEVSNNAWKTAQTITWDEYDRSLMTAVRRLVNKHPKASSI